MELASFDEFHIALHLLRAPQWEGRARKISVRSLNKRKLGLWELWGQGKHSRMERPGLGKGLLSPPSEGNE